MNQFKVHERWLLDELYMLHKKVTAEVEKKEFTEDWPKPFSVYKEDVEVTIQQFNDLYDNSKTHCGLVKIHEKLEDSTTIEYAFYSFHVLAHIILQELRPELNEEDLLDVSHQEMVCALFGLIACHRYFGLPCLTPALVDELSAIVGDAHTAEQITGQSKYSAEERLKDVSKIFNGFIKTELPFLH